MRIRYSQTHPTNPGKIVHIENTIGKTIVALGQAEDIGIPRRSQPGWLEYMQERSATVAHADDTPAPFATTPQWSAARHPLSKLPFIYRALGSETQMFDFIPADCPNDVADAFTKLVRAHNARAEADANAKPGGHWTASGSR
jgi:hypothetical protein